MFCIYRYRFLDHCVCIYRWSVSVFVALHRHTWPIFECEFRYRRPPLAPVYTFVFTWWPDDPTLSTVTLQITQFRCLWSCSLELSTSSRSRLIFIIIIIILFLQPSQNCTFLKGAWR